MPMGSHHLVLRIVPTVEAAGRQVRVIDAHNEVAGQSGRVAVGKFGAPIGIGIMAGLTAALATQPPPELYLVTREGDRFHAHRSTLVWVGSGLPSDFASTVPAYYRELRQPPSTWLVVDGPFVPTNLDGLVLASNRRPVAAVLAECRTVAMLVEPEGKLPRKPVAAVEN